MSTHDPEKEVISMQINKNGCYECDTLRSLLSALVQSKEASLIDIGDNIGMYSLHAASYGRPAVAFEPYESNHEKFCQSILANAGFKDRIKVVAVALTDDPDIQYVEFNKDAFDKAVYRRNRGRLNLGSMQVNKSKSLPSGDLGMDYSRAFTIDSLQEVKDLLPGPGSHVILKVDVKGSQCRALSGAFEYLKKVHIDYVVIEWTPERMMACQEDGVISKIYDLFARKGLHAYKLIGSDKSEWVKVDLETPEVWAKGMFDMAFFKGIPSFDITV